MHSTVPGALGGEDAKDLDLAFKELGEIRKLFLKIDHKEVNWRATGMIQFGT